MWLCQVLVSPCEILACAWIFVVASGQNMDSLAVQKARVSMDS